MSFFSVSLHAQMQGKKGPRSFFDMLALYAVDNNMTDPGESLGAGINLGYSLGTHNLMLRGILGFETTTNVQVPDVEKNLYYNPFVGFEAGGGLWRSNGNQCGAKKQYAFTVLPKVGIRYNIGSRDGDIEQDVEPIESGVDYYGALELGYFFLDSYFKNSELYIEGGYFFLGETVYARLGFRTFINTKAVKR
jgi:hypothetical protein